MNKLIISLRKSKCFYEGKSSPDNWCKCKKCQVSANRHLREIHDKKPEEYPPHSYWNYLNYCIRSVDINGLWIEFGVHKGTTIKYIASKIKPEIIYGFDSFEGLPEDWIVSDDLTFQKEAFDLFGIEPSIPYENICLIKGWFNSSLKSFLKNTDKTCSFIHIDCDLYCSTKTVLNLLAFNERIIKGTIVLFDEFYNYPKYFQNEFKAFCELIRDYNLKFEFLAHTDSDAPWNGQQVAIRFL